MFEQRLCLNVQDDFDDNLLTVHQGALNDISVKVSLSKAQLKETDHTLNSMFQKLLVYFSEKLLLKAALKTVTAKDTSNSNSSQGFAVKCAGSCWLWSVFIPLSNTKVSFKDNFVVLKLIVQI